MNKLFIKSARILYICSSWRAGDDLVGSLQSACNLSSCDHVNVTQFTKIGESKSSVDYYPFFLCRIILVMM